MSDEPTKHSRAWIGWALVAVFVLYPLSVGPVGFIAGITTGRRPSGLVFNVFYAPLALIGQAVPAIVRPLESYYDAFFEEGRSFHRWR
jgi:hypothetical protein